MKACPFCDAGWPVTRVNFYDGQGSKRMHVRGSVTFDTYESHFCARNDWFSRHRFATGLIIFYAVAALLACLSLGNARAHDLPTDWIGQEKRTNAAGTLCCGKGDCVSFTVDQVKVMPDGYHFPDGEVVPFNKVAPSIDNLYWICRWGGETKCTFAPLGAS